MANEKIDINTQVGRAFKRLRQARKLRQFELAKAMGISPTLLSRFENGKANSRVNLNTIRDGALALGLKDLTSLISWAERDFRDAPMPTEIAI